MALVKLTRLLAWLNKSPIKENDNALYQTIRELVKEVQALQDAFANLTITGANTIINNPTNFILLDSGSDDGGGGGDIGPPGVAGADGANGMVPYFIASGETFTVPEFKQALFAMNIDNEGILDVEGFLIEVD